MNKTLILALFFSVLFLSACSIFRQQRLGQQPCKGKYSKEFVYGSRCGNAGINPSERYFFQGQLDSNKLDIIVSYLDCDTMELRAYATEYAIRYIGMGNLVTQATSEKIERNLSTEACIWTCSGCTYAIKPMSSVLNVFRREFELGTKAIDPR